MTASFTLTQTPVSKNIWLYPDGDFHSGCSVVGSASHYLNVDDPYDMPDDDTTYNWMMGTSTVTDLYTLENHGSETGTINYVKIFARAKTHLYPWAATADYRILYNSTTTVRSDKLNLTTDYNTFNILATTAPGGGAWSWANIDALKIGWEAISPTIPIILNTTFRPNAVGTANENERCENGTYVGAGDATNYTYIDEETADNKITYLRNNWSSTDRDSYNIPNNPGFTGTINYVSLYGTIKSGYPHGSLYFGLRCGAIPAYYDSTIFQPYPCDWALYSYTWTINPGTSLAWTWANINDLEIGFITGGTSNCYCTQLYLVVNHIENISPHIHTTQMYTMVNYTPSSGSCYLSKPHTYTYTNNRDVRKINLWNTERKVYDLARTSKTLTMMGIEYPRPGSTPTTALNCVRAMKDNGGYITISGIGDTLIDTDWLIQDFSYSKNTENPFIYDWVLTMERYENV